MRGTFCLNEHPEKCFSESTKIWLAQRNFLFKYWPMEILFELTKKYFFSILINQKIHRLKKKSNCKLKLHNYCGNKEKIFLIQVKLTKFCKNVCNIFFLEQQTFFFFYFNQKCCKNY